MARPKGSKNKTTEQAPPVQEPVPFNYELDDAKFNASYQQRLDAPPSDRRLVLPPSAGQFDPVFVPTNEANTFRMPENNRLFLVEGEVQLASRSHGRGAMVAKQTRLVEAADEMQAINKYVAYFNGLSDDQSVYRVINAAAMETIR